MKVKFPLLLFFIFLWISSGACSFVEKNTVQTIIPTPTPQAFSEDEFKNLILQSLNECPQACFLTIQPGITNIHDAFNIIKNDKNFTEPTLSPSPALKDTSYLETNVMTIDRKYYLYAQYLRSEEITQYLAFNPPPISLGELIHTFGQPEYVFPIAEAVHPDFAGWSVELIWLSKGLAVGTGGEITKTQGPPRIDANLIFEDMTLFEPSLEGYRTFTNPNVTINDFSIWDGYRDFYEYYRQR